MLFTLRKYALPPYQYTTVDARKFKKYQNGVPPNEMISILIFKNIC
jgi:hypothetical protein